MTPFTTISELLFKRLQSALSEQEESLLNAWLSESEHHRAFSAETQDEDRLRAMILAFQRLSTRESEQRVLDRLTGQFFAAHRMHFTKTAWFRWVAAAAVIFIIGAVAYLWKTDQHTLSVVKSNPAPMRNDVAPGGNRAVLTLADGRTIALDSAANGELATQGPAQITKEADGEIRYTVHAGKSLAAITGTNTMSTPRGGQYELRLPDGTHVWLNAESSITYPVAFTGKQRQVRITGEAYFEVAKNTAMPFSVQTGDVTVQVLGTHFNVNAYANEAGIRTTLLEGSVKVTRGTTEKTLSPRQQAVVSANQPIQLMSTVDLDAVMAWKNGQFAFHEADIQTIMRQVERWYDVEVIYKANIDQHFVANIPRNVPVSKLLHLLELTNHVHFQIQDNTITVLP